MLIAKRARPIALTNEILLYFDLTVHLERSYILVCLAVRQAWSSTVRGSMKRGVGAVRVFVVVLLVLLPRQLLLDGQKVRVDIRRVGACPPDI